MKRFNALEEEILVFRYLYQLLGAAYLAKNKKEAKDYIAKKILMGSLEKNEQDSALLEVNLLKALNHPNIVSYKTSFIS